MTGGAVVLFSGGQDSTTCLGWALSRHTPVLALTIHYGQQHAVEVTAATRICAALNVEQRLVTLPFLPGFVRSALTDGGAVDGPHPDHPELPASFVPNRNALFLTIAHTYAQTIGVKTVVAGVCQTDFSGYPDCREEFITALSTALNLGSAAEVTIATPLMHLDKGQTFALAESVGVLDLVLQESHTCYRGVRTAHPWGAGCGTCPACTLRERGWRVYMATR